MPFPTRIPRFALPAALCGLAAVADASAQEAGDLTLNRVMLSTGGVGYFEYRAAVAGDADLTFDVPLDQVDDVLKSLVVYDDRGRIGEVSLPGREPLEEAFRGLPFGPSALQSPTALFNALRGAEIRSGGTREIAGRIISVVPEEARLPEGGTVTRHRLSVLSEAGVRQLVLEEADEIAFADPALQEQVDDALAALARHRERDRREIALRLEGEGERTARVAYVVEVPLWKATYRLTLPDGREIEEAGLQGWAVIENLTGRDWDGVELTVASGNPVTFRQALYEAYFVDRPEVPVEVLGRVLPLTDTGATAMRPEPAPAPGMQPRGADTAAAARLGALAGVLSLEAAPAAPAPTRAEVAEAEAAQAATQVLFTFPEPVSVDSGHSLLLPVIGRDVPAERLSLYQPETHATHPLASVRLVNDGDSGLPPGVITLYERDGAGQVAYVGDARLATLPAGEERLISFAVDQRVRIDREQRRSQRISEGTIVDGVLRLTMTDRAETVYRIAGAAEEPRTVLIEHPRQQGWDLVAPPPAEADLTETAYRLTVDVPAAATEILTVAVERPRYQRLQLVDLSRDQIALYAEAERLSEAVREAVEELAGYRAAVRDAEAALSELQGEYDALLEDQARIRRNLDAVPRDSDLYERYLATLGEQEDRVDELTAAIQAAREAVAAARQALAEYARGLEIPG
jgi:hypothetical protein